MISEKPSFTILCSGFGSFYQQALGLLAGFKKLNCEAKLEVLVKKEREDYSKCKGNWVIGIGSWRDWEILYQKPKKLGIEVFPWLVSDDKVLKYVEEINKTKVIFVTSNFCKNTFLKAGVKKEKMELIYEGIDTHFWKPISKNKIERMKKLLNLPNDKVILLTIGGDATSKGAQETLRALKSLSHLNFLYVLKTMVGGDAFFEGEKEKRIYSGTPLEKKVKYFMGNFSNEFILSLINLCDIYIAPSRHEGFGLPHVQAMACKKPVITCKGTAAEETSIDGVTGFVVSSRPFRWKNAKGYLVDGVRANISELKLAIEKLIKDKRLREKMGENARRHVVKNFEAKKTAKNFIEKLKRYERD